MRTETKPEGFAISKIYPGALVSSQAVVYEITNVYAGDPISLEPETYSRMQEMVEVVSEIVLQDYPDLTGKKPSEVVRLMNEFNSKVQINRIESALAQITPSLEMFRCSKHSCGFFGPANWFKYHKCPKCGSRPIQAPVSVLKVPAQGMANPEIIRPLRGRPCSKCQSKGGKTFLGMVAGPGSSTAPLSNMLWRCSNCKTTMRIYAPDKYKLDFLNEQYTQAITVSTADVKQDGDELNHGGLLSPLVTRVTFVPEVEVTSITPGYRVGASYSLQATKRLPNNRIYGRQFSTKGIKFEVDTKAYRECLEAARGVFIGDEDVFNEWLHTEIEKPKASPEAQEFFLRRWVLHSFAHGLLSMISEKTDLEPMKFSGTYDPHNSSVIVYDNEFGGIGGVESLADDEGAFLDYLELCRHTVETCDCRFQCPRCLFIYGCGEVNQALFRHLLGPLFEVDTFYL